MSNQPSPLKYMGTQSRETMSMAAAMAHAVESSERRTDAAMGTVSGEVDEAGSMVGDAARRAIDKARNTVRFAAGQARERATTAVATYTRDDPVRAALIAAATGAVLMALLARLTRSGGRAVGRRLRR